MESDEPMIARPWRALRTGVAFVVFGLYSLWIFATTVPWARLMSRDPIEQVLRIQATVRDALRWFIDFMCWLGLMHFQWRTPRGSPSPAS